MRAKLKDVSLYFDVDGAQLVPAGERMQERPTMLLLHGGPGYDHTHFKPGFSTFRDDAQLVFIDQRGQGRSDRSERSRWNLATWADDVAAFCEALSIRKPILLGASFGGFVAIAAATRHPDLASGVVLIGTAAHIRIDRIVSRFGELGGPSAAAAARAFFTDPGDARIIQDYIKHCFPLYSRTGFDPMLAPRSIVNFDVTSHFFRPGHEYQRLDYLSELPRIDVPVLILHGELDPIVPVEFARETYDALNARYARLEIFSDCSHDVLRDKGPEATALIRRFIQSQANAGF